MDQNDIIQILLVSTILMPATPASQPGSLLTDYKKEKYFIKLPYATFMKDVLHNIIEGYKIIKASKTDHKVLLNRKKPDGLAIQVMTSAYGYLCLDIR